MRARTQLWLFGAAYRALHGRPLAHQRRARARDRPRRVDRPARTAASASPSSTASRTRCTAAPPMWLLSNIYLAAQLAVLPGALLYLYRRAPAVYRRLRDTVLATWAIADPRLRPVPRRAAAARRARHGRHRLHAGRRQPHRPLHHVLQRARRRARACTAASRVAIGIASCGRRAAALDPPRSRPDWGPRPVTNPDPSRSGNHYVFDIAAGLLASAAGYGVAAARRPVAAAMIRLARRLSPRRGSVIALPAWRTSSGSQSARIAWSRAQTSSP